ncbi:flagellar biosynthesis protein FlhB [bacterium]|nr:flagellar biosynthesis protein FlhB [bacterium]
MSEQASGEKTEDPTPKRKQDARKKGQVAKSTDLTGAVTLFAAAMAIPIAMGIVGDGAVPMFAKQMSSAPRDLTPNSIMGFLQGIAMPWFMGTVVLMLILGTVGVMTNLGQVGLLFTTEPITPKFEKINPLSGFKRIFSKRGAMEGVKAIAKLGIFGYIAYSVIAADWSNLVGLIWLHPAQGAIELGKMLHSMLVKIALVWLIIAALDYFFQRKETEKQIKMTKQELKQEMKEQEGSPEVKSAQYQKRRQLLKGGMAKQLKEADVLITNPTHFAVAIKYKRNSMHAPVVLAKGQDHLALKMREIAAGSDLPIVENVPLARALYKQCEAGDFVPRDLFGPVAEVLAYVYKTVKERRAG